MIKKIILLLFLLGVFLSPVYAQVGRDIDNDGVWDADKGGVDRDLDNDGVWDSNLGEIDETTSTFADSRFHK